MTVSTLTTPALLYLCKRAEVTNRNRQVYTDQLANVIDDDGTHLVAFRFPHNDVEWRCHIMVKVRGSTTPEDIWLDVSFEDWNNCIQYQNVREPSALEQLGLASLD